MLHKDSFNCLSTDIKVVISKEMIKDSFMVRAEDGGYLIPSMRILKRYIEQELEARVLVTKRLPTQRITNRNEAKLKDKRVQFKDKVFTRMQQCLKKMKELTKTLKEQKEVVKEVELAENEDVKKLMEQLNELTNLATPQNKIINNSHSINQDLRQRNNFPPPPTKEFPYVPEQNPPRPVESSIISQKKENKQEDVIILLNI
ncbi:hypothetical protein O181_011360 [Austropuccinia psidii MF-1]|uniref:Uncharacterized protein n=1 Tax=Austropuccinia psidii MF-1 TaxID=1389203 RepID=A0A9Q3BVS1_9BASI|nr:hypothetical protein [Austropuccinia psidii MF-1]